MIYEIINPSDTYTIETGDFEVAVAACLLLGGGRYGFKPEKQGESEVPICIFDGGDRFLQKHFGLSVEEFGQRVINEKTDALATCLESILIGDFSDRREFLDACSYIDNPEKLKAFQAKRHDDLRTSMNDIGACALSMARNLRQLMG